MAENIIVLQEDNFNTEVKQSEQLVLVDFWAEWCGPCKMVSPVVEELANEYAGKIKVGKVNVEQQEQVVSDNGVMSVPTLIFFKEGKEVERVVGFKSKSNLAALIDKQL